MEKKTELSKEILDEIDKERARLFPRNGHNDDVPVAGRLGYGIAAKKYALKYQQEKQKLDEAMKLLERVRNSCPYGMQKTINRFLTSHKSGGENLEG